MNDLQQRDNLSFLPQTDEDRREMLEAIGVPAVESLFTSQIPEKARFTGRLNLPGGLAEQDITSLMEAIAAANSSRLVSFLGAGAYDHYIPSVVESIVSRSEFVTAYTPYQPEASQGLLQSIYEYQSLICGLTGMDVSNASLYDAGTAIGEAAIMAYGITRRSRCLVARTVHPHYRQVLNTYVHGVGIVVDEIGFRDGLIDFGDLETKMDASVGCVIVQYPSFFGTIDDLNRVSDVVHNAGALLVVCADPIALGILKPPGLFGADIVVGDGQPMGIPIGFGGPYIGLFACKKEHLWHIPGRIVGATTDIDGNRAYTLTLQTREQHIRREKATSNICTNQALMALAVTVYLSTLGKNGLKRVAELCYQKAHYLRRQLLETAGWTSSWDAPFFKEFVVKPKTGVAKTNQKLIENGILGGLDLGRYYPELESSMLLCVTEKRSKEQIDRLVELMV